MSWNQLTDEGRVRVSSAIESLNNNVWALYNSHKIQNSSRSSSNFYTDITSEAYWRHLYGNSIDIYIFPLPEWQTSLPEKFFTITSSLVMNDIKLLLANYSLDKRGNKATVTRTLMIKMLTLYQIPGKHLFNILLKKIKKLTRNTNLDLIISTFPNSNIFPFLDPLSSNITFEDARFNITTEPNYSEIITGNLIFVRVLTPQVRCSMVYNRWINLETRLSAGHTCNSIKAISNVHGNGASVLMLQRGLNVDIRNTNNFFTTLENAAYLLRNGSIHFRIKQTLINRWVQFIEVTHRPPPTEYLSSSISTQKCLTAPQVFKQQPLISLPKKTKETVITEGLKCLFS